MHLYSPAPSTVKRENIFLFFLSATENYSKTRRAVTYWIFMIEPDLCHIQKENFLSWNLGWTFKNTKTKHVKVFPLLNWQWTGRDGWSSGQLRFLSLGPEIWPQRVRFCVINLECFHLAFQGISVKNLLSTQLSVLAFYRGAVLTEGLHSWLPGLAGVCPHRL